MEIIFILLNLAILISWIARLYYNHAIKKGNQRILEGIATGTQQAPHRTITEQEQHVINEVFNFPYDADFGVRKVSGEARVEQDDNDVSVFIDDVVMLLIAPSMAAAVKAEGQNVVEVIKLQGQELPIALSVNDQAYLANALEELEVDPAYGEEHADVGSDSADSPDTIQAISQGAEPDSIEPSASAAPKPSSRLLGKRELSDAESNTLAKRLEAKAFCLPTLTAALLIITIGHSFEMSFSLLYLLLALSGIAIVASGGLFYLVKRPGKTSGEVIRIQATVTEVSKLADCLLVDMPGLNGDQRLRLNADKRWLHHLPCGVSIYFEYHSPSHTLLQVRNTHLDGLGAPPASKDKARYRYLAKGMLGLAFAVTTLVSWPQLKINGLIASLDQQLTIAGDDSWPESMPVGLQLKMAQPRKCIDPLENSNNAQTFCRSSVVDPSHEYQEMVPELVALGELLDSRPFRPKPNDEQLDRLRFLEMQATVTGQNFRASDARYYWEGAELYHAVTTLNEWCEFALEKCQVIKEGLIELYPKLSGNACGDDNAACWKHMSGLSKQSYEEFQYIYVDLPYSTWIDGQFKSSIYDKLRHLQFADYPTATNPESPSSEILSLEKSAKVTLHFLSKETQADDARKRINSDNVGFKTYFTHWYNGMLERFEAYQRQSLHGVVIDYQNHDGNIELWLDGDLSYEQASKQLALAGIVLLSLLISAWAAWRMRPEG
ncbi:hypothetical protein [Aliagarivorans marinus]|uniref:hypothetical protein n=1 Tax=Aliagarivorans marinus TaxID=561965 RepID=UPI0003FB80C3|nr:hypothetical protein [Aliagarivorans marinus]